MAMMCNIFLAVCLVLVAEGRKLVSKEAAQLEHEKMIAYKTMMKLAPPSESLEPAECGGNNDFCRPFTKDEMPWKTTLALQEKAFGVAMRAAFGADIGNVWEDYLTRRYSQDRYIGPKAHLMGHVTRHTFGYPDLTMDGNIKLQFQGDPTNYYTYTEALDFAMRRLVEFINCHREEFSVPPDGPMPDPTTMHFQSVSSTSSSVSSDETPKKWFAVSFEDLLHGFDFSADDMPPGYLDIEYGGDGSGDTCSNHLYHAPANLAGGMGGSDFGRDFRFMSGHLHCHISKVGNVNVYCRPKVKLSVFDAIDLCPGQCGTKKEQLLTIPLSQREASGLAYDVPLFVEFYYPVDEEKQKYSYSLGLAPSAEECARRDFQKVPECTDCSEYHQLTMKRSVRFMDEDEVPVALDFKQKEYEDAIWASRKQCDAQIYKMEGVLEHLTSILG